MKYPEFLEEWRNQESFIKVYSSGSTGRPKEILLEKEFIIQSAERTIRFFNLNSDSLLHSCVSPDFIGGKMMAVRAELSGGFLSWEMPSNRPLGEFNKEKRIALLAVVPTQMEYILENQDRMPVIENIIIGGAPIPARLRKRICESRLNAYETYGMTETASHIALRKIEDEELPFKTFDGIKVTSDEDNCLIIRFKDGRIVETNDVCQLISSEEFFILGRRDNIINSGGLKINPEEIEKRLKEEFGQQFIFTGLPDEKWGEKVVLLMEDTEGKTEKEKILNICRKILPSWQVPKEIYLVREIPKTPNGKVKRPKRMEDFSSFLL